MPKLRFPEFSGKWEEKKIGDLFEFISTNSFSRANLNYENGKVKNIHYGDIHTKFQTNLDCEKAEIPFINSDVNLDKIKKESYCKNGDLIIADASEDYDDIGKAIELKNVNNAKLLAGLHTFLARDNSGFTVEGYRGYMLLNDDLKLEIKKIATGISVLGISKTNLAKLKVQIPSINEQKKIASFLSKVDEKIGKLEKKQELWETYQKEMMRQIFSQKLRFKDGNGEGYPDWEEKKLGEISKIQRGASPRPIAAKKWYTSKKNVGWVRITDVTKSNKFLLQTEDYFSEEGIKKSRYLPKGSLIMSICATIGKPIITGINTCIHDGFIGFSDLKNVKKEFLYYYLSVLEKKFISLGQTGSQANLNSDLVRITKIYIPSIQEQEKIVSYLVYLDKKMELIDKELNNNREFKKGLLQQMFC